MPKKSRNDMSFRVASRGSGSVSSSAVVGGSVAGAGSMAMSISGSSSASSAVEGAGWVVEGSGAEVGLGFGEAMVESVKDGRCG